MAEAEITMMTTLFLPKEVVEIILVGSSLSLEVSEVALAEEVPAADLEASEAVEVLAAVELREVGKLKISLNKYKSVIMIDFFIINYKQLIKQLRILKELRLVKDNHLILSIFLIPKAKLS